MYNMFVLTQDDNIQVHDNVPCFLLAFQNVEPQRNFINLHRSHGIWQIRLEIEKLRIQIERLKEGEGAKGEGGEGVKGRRGEGGSTVYATLDVTVSEKKDNH